MKILQLESNSDCILSSIQKLMKDDRAIYISDSQNLFSFDFSGKFLYKYGEKGNAENEYINLSTFMFDNDGNIVIADSYTGKLLTYSKEGEFLKCEKLDIDLIKYIQDGRYLDEYKIFISNYIYNEPHDLYSIIDIKENKRLGGKVCEITSQNTMEMIGRHPFTEAYGRNGVKYIFPFSSEIFAEDGEPVYNIFTSKSKLTAQELTEINDFSIMTYFNAMEKNEFMGFTDIFESGNKIILLCKNIGLTIIDKNNNSCRNYNLESYDFPFMNLWNFDQNQCLATIMPMALLPPKIDQFKKHYYISSDLPINYDGNPIIISYTLPNEKTQ